MSFNGSFGDGEIEEEINLNDLAKIKEKENSIDNMVNSVDTVPKNNDIFNSVFTTEIDNHDELKKLEFFQTQLIQEKINYNIVNLFKVIISLKKIIALVTLAFMPAIFFAPKTTNYWILNQEE